MSRVAALIEAALDFYFGILQPIQKSLPQKQAIFFFSKTQHLTYLNALWSNDITLRK